nr:hypothetical protein [uncultured Roseobacter sp.]
MAAADEQFTAHGSLKRMHSPAEGWCTGGTFFGRSGKATRPRNGQEGREVIPTDIATGVQIFVHK